MASGRCVTLSAIGFFVGWICRQRLGALLRRPTGGHHQPDNQIGRQRRLRPAAVRASPPWAAVASGFSVAAVFSGVNIRTPFPMRKAQGRPATTDWPRTVNGSPAAPPRSPRPSSTHTMAPSRHGRSSPPGHLRHRQNCFTKFISRLLCSSVYFRIPRQRRQRASAGGHAASGLLNRRALAAAVRQRSPALIHLLLHREISAGRPLGPGFHARPCGSAGAATWRAMASAPAWRAANHCRAICPAPAVPRRTSSAPQPLHGACSWPMFGGVVPDAGRASHRVQPQSPASCSPPSCRAAPPSGTSGGGPHPHFARTSPKAVVAPGCVRRQNALCLLGFSSAAPALQPAPVTSIVRPSSCPPCPCPDTAVSSFRPRPPRLALRFVGRCRGPTSGGWFTQIAWMIGVR